MLLLPAKFMFVKLELKQNSKTEVDVYSVGQFFAKPMLGVGFLYLIKVFSKFAGVKIVANLNGFCINKSLSPVTK